MVDTRFVDGIVLMTLCICLLAPPAGLYLALATENVWWLWLCLPIVIFL